MRSRPKFQRLLLGREVAVSFVVIAALYLIRFGRIQPLQIPAYLLIVSYDIIEVAIPVLTPYHPITFPLFLYLLAIVSGALARWFRADAWKDGFIPRSVGGVCLIVGSISLAFGAYVGGPLIAPADNPTPLAITGATGVVLLMAGGWLLRRPTSRSTTTT